MVSGLFVVLIVAVGVFSALTAEIVKSVKRCRQMRQKLEALGR